MKKIFIPSILFLVISVLISSCGSSSSITKRHYNKGYYIQQDKKVAVLNEKNNSETALSANELSTPEVESSIDKPSAESNSGVALQKENALSKTKQTEKVEQPIKGITSNFKNPVSHVKQALQKIKKTTSTKGEGDGYSLFWIAIVVLLILWILGYLGGLGSFIHLLLLVALILLILWLLRLI